ncbi:NAD-dependent dehydratase, partial [Solihabitans fulvus]
IAAAFLAAQAAPREAVHTSAFNVGMAENNATVAEIAEQVAAVVPGSRLVITGEAGGDPRSYRVDFSRIRALLPDYDPQWTVRAGAAELYEAYLRHGL